jgi:hypothetical protein
MLRPLFDICARPGKAYHGEAMSFEHKAKAPDDMALAAIKTANQSFMSARSFRMSSLIAPASGKETAPAGH